MGTSRRALVVGVQHFLRTRQRVYSVVRHDIVSGFRRGLGVASGIVASLVLLLLSPSPARAQEDSARECRSSSASRAAMHLFAHNLELGVADDPALPSPKSTGCSACALGAGVQSRCSLIEVEGVGIPTGATPGDRFRLLASRWRAHVLNILPGAIAGGKLRPFILAGVGRARRSSPRVGTRVRRHQEGHRRELLRRRRRQVRAHRAGSRCASTGACWRRPTPSTNGFSPDCEITGAASASRSAATRRRRRRRPAAAGQGHRRRRHPRRRRTSARTSPRTRTASRTTTAAPIPTTTATASPTRKDKCPNEPEDKDGFQDDDGCPDDGQRRRRHPRREGQVPERGRGQGRLPGRRRLPRSRQRRRRHPRRGRQVPERAGDQERLPGRGRLPRRGARARSRSSPASSRASTSGATRRTSRRRRSRC